MNFLNIVLVHCSDGWDRTAQLTSLAMLMMDSHYRTLNGFVTLIDKEWFSMGHKFCERFGFSTDGWGSDDRSPVFQQFIECVYQMMAQMPNVFEFNEALLIFILQAVQSGYFGNVYTNSEKEQLEIRSCTLSLWSVVYGNITAFTNCSYSFQKSVCIPITSIKRINVWSNWFLAWHDTIWSRIWQRRMESLQAADESFIDSLLPPMRWMENNSTKNCSESDCHRPFTVYRRRHHCRVCGLIFCERCSNYKRIVPAVSSSLLSRTCKNCANLIDMTNRYNSRNTNRPHAMRITISKTTVPRIESEDSTDDGRIGIRGYGDFRESCNTSRNFNSTQSNISIEKCRSHSFSDVM